MNHDLEIVCSNHLQDNVFNHLIGKTCYLNICEDSFDLFLNSNTPFKVLEVNGDFMKKEREVY